MCVVAGTEYQMSHRRCCGATAASAQGLFGVKFSLELNRSRPAELVRFTSRKLTELLHRRVQSALVESKMGAVAWGQWPALRFPSHRVTGGGHPPPVPTERGVRISRTNALRKLVHSTASACSSEYGRRSLGGSNGVRFFDLVEGVPGEAASGPAAAAQHPAPVTLHDPIYFDETPKISGDAVISIVAA